MEFLQDTNFWVTVSFLIFAAIAYHFGKDAVLSMLDEKIKQIKTDIETAENLRVEAQELLAQYQRKHKDALAESEEIVESARIQALQIKKNIDHEAEQVIKLRETQLADRLKRMEQRAVAEIRSQVTDVAAQAAYEIISKKLGKKANEELVSQTIETLPEKLKAS